MCGPQHCSPSTFQPMVRFTLSIIGYFPLPASHLFLSFLSQPPPPAQLSLYLLTPLQLRPSLSPPYPPSIPHPLGLYSLTGKCYCPVWRQKEVLPPNSLLLVSFLSFPILCYPFPISVTFILSLLNLLAPWHSCPSL